MVFRAVETVSAGREGGTVADSDEMKAPSSKLQAPEKNQAPNSSETSRQSWNLKFGASLELGAWSLVFSQP
jgi:hypothetical protein